MKERRETPGPGTLTKVTLQSPIGKIQHYTHKKSYFITMWRKPYDMRGGRNLVKMSPKTRSLQTDLGLFVDLNLFLRSAN